MYNSIGVFLLLQMCWDTI